MTKLSIIIVNYNVKYFVEQCLHSIFASNFPYEKEVFVVDNLSTDGSIEYLNNRFLTVHFVENTHNEGFAKANNQALKMAQGEYVLLLNPDTVLGENVLKNVCLFLDENKQAGAVGVKMIDGSGQFLPESKRGFPTPWNSFCKMIGLSKLFPRSTLFSQYRLLYLNENQVHQVDVLSGAFLCTRKKIMDQIGGLDESFFMYGEDIDLSFRIQKTGFKNYYLPEKIVHYKGESTNKNQLKYIARFYGAMTIFFKKHYPNYSIFFRFFIVFAIQVLTLFSAIKQKIHVLLKYDNQQRNNNKKKVTFSRSDYSFETIIDRMDNGDKMTDYRIYSPQTNMIIGSHTARKKKR